MVGTVHTRNGLDYHVNCPSLMACAECLVHPAAIACGKSPLLQYRGFGKTKAAVIPLGGFSGFPAERIWSVFFEALMAAFVLMMPCGLRICRLQPVFLSNGGQGAAAPRIPSARESAPHATLFASKYRALGAPATPHQMPEVLAAATLGRYLRLMLDNPDCSKTEDCMRTRCFISGL